MLILPAINPEKSMTIIQLNFFLEFRSPKLDIRIITVSLFFAI